MARPAEVLTVGGIDPNSHKIAIVETRKGNKRKPFIHTYDFGSGEYEDRCAAAFDYVFEFVMEVRERDGVSPRLFLEAPVMGVGGPGATIPQAFVSGAILAGAAQGGARISLVNNQSWKKRVCGNGGFNKLAVSHWAEAEWPELYKRVPIISTQAQGKELKGRADQDVIDAGCINWFGWNTVELVERMWRRRNG